MPTLAGGGAAGLTTIEPRTSQAARHGLVPVAHWHGDRDRRNLCTTNRGGRAAHASLTLTTKHCLGCQREQRWGLPCTFICGRYSVLFQPFRQFYRVAVEAVMASAGAATPTSRRAPGWVDGAVNISAIARKTSIGVNGLERKVVAPAFFAASRV